MSFDMTAASAALKEYYSGQRLETLVYRNNPFLALVKKNEKAEGSLIPYPVQYGTPQGGSSTFAKAQTNQTNPSLARFAITLANEYGTAQIDNKTMLASASSAGAFIDAASLVIDGLITSVTNVVAASCFGSGTGSIGQISAISTGVITLVDPDSVTQFEVGQVLQANSSDGGGSPRAALGYVIAVDRSGGTVTVSASSGGSAGSPSGWAANDYLLREGDNNAKQKGLAAWLPTTAPSSTSFFGVDRSVDSTRLAGVRLDASDRSIEEAFTDILGKIYREGGSPDTIVVGYQSWAALEKGLQSRVQYTDLKGPADLMFRAIQVNGPNGPVKVIMDRSCPQKVAYVLDMSTWELLSLRKAPHILTYDREGLEMLRVSNADAVEVRVGAYLQLACKAPAFNGVVKLSA